MDQAPHHVPKRHAIRCAILSLLVIMPPAVFGQNNSPGATQATVAKYVRALQQRDFKTLIDLSAHYQNDIARIKAANPQVLWPKLINEYYQNKISDLSQRSSGYWQDYGEALGAMIGDPARGIRAAVSLIPATSTWNISEVRQQTVYVSVNYPAISEAPIIGSSQVLRSAIFQFSTDGRNLVYSIQRVSRGDTFWTGGPDVRLAMAKRFLGAGLWDSAIAQLQPLESQNQISGEARGVLASAYYQHVVNQCFTTTTNANSPGYPKYQVFNSDSQCMAYVTKALSLNPSLRNAWANKLLSEVNVSFQAGALDSASTLVKMASEFTAGDRQLQTLSTKWRQDIATQYLRWTVYGFAHQGHGDSIFEQGYRRQAAELMPDVMQMRGLAVVKDSLQEAANLKARGDGFADMYFFGILGFMKKFAINIPPTDMLLFLQYANQTNSPDKWRTEVQELASTSSAPIRVAAPPSPTPAATASSSTPGTASASANASTSPAGQSGGTDSSMATLRSNIAFARTTAATMPLYNGDWRSVAILTLSNSLSAHNQLYLAAVNRRSIALDQLAAADLFLSKGDTAHAKAYWQKAVYLTLDSESLVHAANNAYSQGVSNTAAVLNAVYRLSSQSAGAVGYLACGTPCYDSIDAITLLTDYAVDNAIQGKSQADQNLIKNGIIKLILDGTGVQKLATTQVTHFVGQPDSVHVVVDQVLNQPQFKTQIMTALGRSSAYATNAALSAAADSLWQALSAINRDCSNIKVPPPAATTNNAPARPVASNLAAVSPASQPPTTTQQALAQPELIGVVYARTPQGQLIELERVTGRMYTRATVVRGVKGIGEIDGPRSSVRFMAGYQVTFLIRLPNDSDAQKFQLWGFGDGNGKRLVTFRVQLDVRRLSGDLYELLPTGTFKWGEFGFSSSDSNDAFCFGVDPN